MGVGGVDWGLGSLHTSPRGLPWSHAMSVARLAHRGENDGAFLIFKKPPHQTPTCPRSSKSALPPSGSDYGSEDASQWMLTETNLGEAAIIHWLQGDLQQEMS